MNELRERMETTLALAEKQLDAQHRAMGLVILDDRVYAPDEVRELVRRALEPEDVARG